ncbi:MAG: AMP-binding protein, partial [Sphingomonadales bacterium]|nr:AMP-binding protein [Sphingomonadales bacterium]
VVQGAELMIADDDGNEVAIGEVGELLLRTRSTIRGYYRNPEASAQEFSNGFWKSGDLGFRDPEGYITIVDRKKDMIITGGFNVYAIEVENTLNSHPAVVMSAVVGIPHEEWGESIHAEIILRPDQAPSEAELIDFAKTRIGRHKVPKSITFVAELPLSPAHKVLRRKVRDKYWSSQSRSIA